MPIVHIDITITITVQISADHTGVAVSRSKFPGPLASVSYPYSDDVIDSRYTVIGSTAAMCISESYLNYKYFISSLCCASDAHYRFLDSRFFFTSIVSYE